MNAREAARFLRAFGDGTRLRIVALLSEKPRSVVQLATVLQSPTPRVSRHLRYLLARGVVDCKADGNAMIYRLATERHGLHRRVLKALLLSLEDIEEVPRDAVRDARKGTE